ncbi:hypothetical protein [Butyrivibrio sp. WCD3002]|uniref:hypothetical protein n=1 Tax=Butyrivibrio sp. WCD3002 TaxID=1280676 RepID=UPI00055CFF2E|nr:hypothetical protein [Butyrivibrio sp. WCD3002]
MANFTSVQGKNPTEMLESLESKMKDQAAFEKMKVDEKMQLFADYLYFQGIQIIGQGDDFSLHRQINHHMLGSSYRRLAQYVTSGEECLKELQDPIWMKMAYRDRVSTQDMIDLGKINAREYDDGIEKGQVTQMRENRQKKIQAARDKRAAQEVADAENRKREEQQEKEREERRIKEEQRRKEEEEELKRQEEEARKEREEQEKKEAEEEKKREAERKEREEREKKEKEEREKLEAAQRDKKEKEDNERREKERLEEERREKERKEREELREKELKENEERREKERKEREEREKIENEERRKREAEKREKEQADRQKKIEELGNKIKDKDFAGLNATEKRNIIKQYLTEKAKTDPKYQESESSRLEARIKGSSEIMLAINKLMEVTGNNGESLVDELDNNLYLQTEIKRGILISNKEANKISPGQQGFHEKLDRKYSVNNPGQISNDTKSKIDYSSLSRHGIIEHTGNINGITNAGEEKTDSKNGAERISELDSIIRRADGAQKNVWFGSGQYDDSVTAIKELKQNYELHKEGFVIDKNQLRSDIEKAERNIQSYFNRKMDRKELTENGAFTNKTDEKSKRRIGVMQDSVKLLADMRKELGLERSIIIDRGMKKDGPVNSLSYNDMLNKHGVSQNKNTGSKRKDNAKERVNPMKEDDIRKSFNSSRSSFSNNGF